MNPLTKEMEKLGYTWDGRRNVYVKTSNKIVSIVHEKAKQYFEAKELDDYVKMVERQFKKQQKEDLKNP